MVSETLSEAGFEAQRRWRRCATDAWAHIRRDFDVATNARLEQVLKLFAVRASLATFSHRAQAAQGDLIEVTTFARTIWKIRKTDEHGRAAR